MSNNYRAALQRKKEEAYSIKEILKLVFAFITIIVVGVLGRMDIVVLLWGMAIGEILIWILLFKCKAKGFGVKVFKIFAMVINPLLGVASTLIAAFIS